MESMLESILELVTGKRGSASVVAPSESPVAKMARPRPVEDDDDDDNDVVRMNITQGYLDNRITLPREIYVKSRRDSYIHDADPSEREVTDPARSYVVVDGVKYPQTTNQGRSSKIQASTFGANREGQTLVFMRESGNKWVSAIKGGGAKSKSVSAPVGRPKGKVAPPSSKGKSAGRFQLPSPQAKGVSKGKTQSANSVSLKDALRTAKSEIEENYENGFVNKSIEQATKNRKQLPTPRMYLNTKQNRALADAFKEHGKNILHTDNPLRRAFGWEEESD